MTALVTGDLHLTVRPDEDYRWRVFKFLAKQAERTGADELILLGDVTDRKDQHPSRLVNRLVAELTGLPFKRIIWLVGNHDYVDPTLPFFKFLDHVPGLRFIDAPTITTVCGHRGLFLPNSRKPQEDWKDLDFGVGLPVFMHQPIAGALTSNGSKIGEDASTTGLVDFIRSKTKSPCWSGDIHVPQKIGPVTYLGSPHPVHFGDSFEPRIGLLKDDGSFESIPRRTLRRKSVVVTGPGELSELDLRKGDHVKVQVSLSRADYGRYSGMKKDIKEEAVRLGIEVHGCALLPQVELLVDAGVAPLPASKSARRPDRQIARFLVARNEPDGDKLHEIGLELFKKGNPGAAEARKAGRLELLSLVVAGFKSYARKSQIRFDNKVHGLWSLFGQNLVEPRLGANGTGKSSLWDALCWCLWGKTSREDFGPSLVNWFKGSKEKCRVVVRVSKGGAHARVVRTQAPNSLAVYLAGDPAPKTWTQEELTAWLGLTLDEFLLSGLMSQFGRYFLDMGHTARLDVFSGIQGLQVWDNASDAASAAVKALGELKAAAAAETARVKGRSDACEEAMNRAKERAEKASRAVVGARQQAAEGSVNQEVAILTSRLQALQETEKKQRGEARSVDVEIEAIQCEEGAFETETYRPAAAEQAKWKAAVSAARDVRGKVLTGGECPSCKQDIPEKHSKRILEAAKKKLDDAISSLSSSTEAFEVVEGQRKGLRLRLEERRIHLRDLRPLQDKTAREIREINGQLSTARAKQSELAGAVAAAEKVMEAAKKERTQASLAFVAAEEEVAAKKKEEQRLELLSGPLEFWKKAFRELRFWLISEALEELSVYANNSLEQLGLEGWHISFEVEKLTGSKTVSRGFHVFIKSPDSPEQVPFESWSGGESQRLRLAVADALGDLLEGRTGVGLNLAVYDEPAAHLSAEGVQDVLSYLAERARTMKKLIWVVDHHPAAHGSFQGEYAAIKDKDGSRLERLKESIGE